MTTTTDHNHSPIKGIISVELRKQFEEFAKDELRRIESALTQMAQNACENSRDIPADWIDCEDCEERVLDSHDSAYGFFVQEFAKIMENHL